MIFQSHLHSWQNIQDQLSHFLFHIPLRLLITVELPRAVVHRKYWTTTESSWEQMQTKIPGENSGQVHMFPSPCYSSAGQGPWIQSCLRTKSLQPHNADFWFAFICPILLAEQSLVPFALLDMWISQMVRRANCVKHGWQTWLNSQHRNP